MSKAWYLDLDGRCVLVYVYVAGNIYTQIKSRVGQLVCKYLFRVWAPWYHDTGSPNLGSVGIFTTISIKIILLTLKIRHFVSLSLIQ